MIQFQGILLTLVVLISIFLTKTAGDNQDLPTQESRKEAAATLEQARASFLADLYAGLAKRDEESAALSAETPRASTSVAEAEESKQAPPASPEAQPAGSFDFESGNLQSCQSLNPEALTARAAVLRYPNYDFNFFEKNTDKRWPIASVTKLMTAVVALEKIDEERQITLSEKAASSEGTAGDFKEGEVFKAKDLMRAMLVVSSNQAAVALAETFGEKDFVDEMQRKAAALKMTQTSYFEPTGLSYLNQSTIKDLSRLADYIYLSHPEIYKISRQKQAEILELKTRKYRKLSNIDEFAGEADFIGGKTGFIEAAGRNLVAMFNIQGKPVLTIVLGSENPFTDTRLMKDFIKYCE